MAENTQSFLAEDEPVSKLKTLSHTIYIFLDPKTREVETLLSNGPFGVSEYDKVGKGWVLCHAEDTWRIHNLFNEYAQYAVDWSNEEAFDKNDLSLAISKYVDGTLDEAWLDENTLLKNDLKA